MDIKIRKSHGNVTNPSHDLQGYILKYSQPSLYYQFSLKKILHSPYLLLSFPSPNFDFSYSCFTIYYYAC